MLLKLAQKLLFPSYWREFVHCCGKARLGILESMLGSILCGEKASS